LKKSKQEKREARKLLRFCMVSGNLDNTRVRVVTERLLQTRRRGYLGLLKRFVHLLKQENAKHSAEIESAVPIPADLRSVVLDRLTAAYGPRVTSSFAENPGLIGGMRIKIGSDVYDGSVRFALARLASSLGIPAASLSGGLK
jgi:F-type H+-transporting ATPase subunit delta